MMDYIINDKLIYSSEDGMIRNTELSELEAVLLTPVLNRIFLVLVMEHGKLITRDDFLRRVWDDYGKTGSSNTLNQYIGILRKLLEMHLDTECIITVPRKGYMLSPDIDIRIEAHDKKPDVTTISAEPMSSDSVLVVDQPPTTLIKSQSNNRAQKNRALIIIVVALFVLSIFLYFFYRSHIVNSVANSEIFQLYKIDSCPVLGEETILNENDKSKVINSIIYLIKKHNLKCNKDDVFYFFYNAQGMQNGIGKYTMLSKCSGKKSGREVCVSYRENRY